MAYSFCIASTANFSIDVAVIVILCLFTIVTITTAVWLLVKFINVENDNSNVGKYITATIIVGAIIRLLFAAFIGGNRYDFTSYNTAIDYFVDNGVFNYYYKESVEIYPLAFYMIALFGGLGRLFGLQSGSAWLTFLVKIPFIIADVFSAFIINCLGGKYINSKVGAVLAALYSLCPVFILASGIYGNAIALMIPFILASFAMIIEKKHFTAIILYSIAMLTSKIAIYLYPIYLLYYGYLFFRAIILRIKHYKNNNIDTNKQKNDLDLIYKLPLYLVFAFLFKYIISLPLIIKDYNANPLKFIYYVFIQPIGSLKYFSYNGLSIYNIFGKNAEPLSITFPSVAFTVCFGVLIVAIVAVVYFSKMNRAVLPILGAYILFTFASYFTDSMPLSVVPVLAILIITFIYTKDVRILRVFSAVALVCTLISLSAMAYGGYFNMLDLDAFTSTSYTGTSALNNGFGLAIAIFCSVISVLAHLYFTFIVFDITMSNNRKILIGQVDAKYFAGVARLCK